MHELSGTCVGAGTSGDEVCRISIHVLRDEQSHIRTLLATRESAVLPDGSLVGGDRPLQLVTDAIEPEALDDAKVEVAVGTCQRDGQDDSRILAALEPGDVNGSRSAACGGWRGRRGADRRAAATALGMTADRGSPGSGDNRIAPTGSRQATRQTVLNAAHARSRPHGGTSAAGTCRCTTVRRSRNTTRCAATPAACSTSRITTVVDLPARVRPFLHQARRQFGRQAAEAGQGAVHHHAQRRRRVIDDLIVYYHVERISA